LSRISTRYGTGVRASRVGLCSRGLIPHRGRSRVRGMRNDRRTGRNGDRSCGRSSRHATSGLVPCGNSLQRCTAPGRRSSVRRDPSSWPSPSVRNVRSIRRMYTSGDRSCGRPGGHATSGLVPCRSPLQRCAAPGRRSSACRDPSSWLSPSARNVRSIRRMHTSRDRSCGRPGGRATSGLVPCRSPFQWCAAPGRTSMRGCGPRLGGAWRSGCPLRRGGPRSHRGVSVISSSTVRRSIVRNT